MQTNYLTILIFYLLLILVLNIFSLPFFSMINKFYYKKKIKTIFLFTTYFNLSFAIIYIVSKLISINFLSSLSRLLNYFMGFLFFGFFISITFWIIYLILKLLKKEKIILKKYICIIIIIFFISINTIAISNFNKPLAIEEYTIYSNKITKNYTFVQISDIQYGTVNKKYMENVMELSYKQNPDFIVFTGDLIDFENYHLSDFKIFKKSKIPIYFERGNHEFYHNPEKILKYLKQTTPIKLLINKKDKFEELEIIGIDHNPTEKQLENKLKTIKINTSKYTILLYHEPKGVDAVINKNIDLALFGHTHAGQIWPVTILIDKIYKYSDGYYKVNNTIIYTTDGAGLWGPKMRLDSQNEIVVFHLKPEK